MNGKKRFAEVKSLSDCKNCKGALQQSHTESRKALFRWEKRLQLKPTNFWLASITGASSQCLITLVNKSFLEMM